MKRSEWGKGVRITRTTIQLPEDLWKAVKFLAVEERTNFQDVVAAALREYLKRRKKGGKRHES
jgi:metal-responsive CopG/Arc/MetJ family transcriptional regulator